MQDIDYQGIKNFYYNYLLTLLSTLSISYEFCHVLRNILSRYKGFNKLYVFIIRFRFSQIQLHFLLILTYLVLLQL